jgi:5-formyltetrahydrofolate cyclo-ligase
MDSKALIREAARALRRDVSPDERRQKSTLAAERVAGLGAIRTGSTLCFYLATNEEVETRPLVARALADGCRVVVPRVAGEGRLELYAIEDLDADVKTGAYGVDEPSAGAAGPIEPEAVDCFVVPGVAFDPSGRRCGSGRGYFDRLLARRAPGSLVVALAFECQLQPTLPAQEHDIPMDFICTEERVLDCRGQSLGERVQVRPAARRKKEVETL